MKSTATTSISGNKQDINNHYDIQDQESSRYHWCQ